MRFYTLAAAVVAFATLAPSASAQHLTRADGSTSALPYVSPPAASAPAASSTPGITITQSSSQAVTGSSVACGGAGLTADNSYFRVFDLTASGVATPFRPTSVSFGVQIAESLEPQTASIKYYTFTNPAGAFTRANLTRLGQTDFVMPDQERSIYTVATPGIFTAAAGSKLVVELRLEDTDNRFYIGSNTAPETGPTYIQSDACGITDPTPYAGINFPDVHWVLNVTGENSAPAGPTLISTPTAINFGSVVVGQSATRTVTLSNNGSATTNISAITATAPYTVNLTGTTLALAPNTSTTFTVTYTPTGGGTANGSVSIASNAPGSPLTIALSGSGNTDVFTTIPAGTTAGAATWQRPETLGEGTAGSCALGTGTDGSAVPYVTRPFTVAAAGNYTLTINYAPRTPIYDGFIALYRGTFNPASPCLNLFGINDDGVTTPANTSSQLANQPLSPGSYTLVVTGYTNGDFGAFTGTVLGPQVVTFTGTAGEGTADNSRSSLSAAPNPARDAARVRFTTATAQDVSVAVYDVTGREVAALYRGAVAADQTVELSLDATSLPSGVYVVRAVGTSVILTQRVTVIR